MTESSAPYRIWWDEETETARCVWAPDSHCGAGEARAVTAELRALGRGEVPLLVDMRGVADIEREAREHFGSDQGGVSAVALLAASAVSKMIANFFIGRQRFEVPTRMFTDEQMAIEWLRQPR